MPKFIPSFAAVCLALFAFSCSKQNSSKSITTAPPPPPVVSITQFSPQETEVDSLVTITGTNFSDTAANDIVTFNDTVAVVKSATSTQLVVVVPAGASTGKIGVKVNGQSATSAQNFVVGDHWTLQSAYPGTVMGYTVSFTVGTKFYVGVGEGVLGSELGVWQQQFWQYDAVTNVWTQKAFFPGIPTGYGQGFSIGGYGYVVNNPDSSGNSTLWQYDTAADNWTRMANLPVFAQLGMVAFGVNGYGYVGLGTLGSFTNNIIWQYDPTANTWTQKNNFPGRATTYTTSFVIGNYAYVGTGQVGLNTDSGSASFFQYNPATDTWTQKGNFPGGPRNSAAGFSVGNYGYLGTGFNLNGNYLSDFWQYNPSSDSWIQKRSFGGGIRAQAAGFSGDSQGFMGFGQGAAYQIQPGQLILNYVDLWQYQP